MWRKVHRDVEGEGEDSRAKGCGKTGMREDVQTGVLQIGRVPPGQCFWCGSSAALQPSRFPAGLVKFTSAPRSGRNRAMIRRQGQAGSMLPLQPPGQCEGQSWTISQALGGYRLGKLCLCQESCTLPENWGIHNHSCSKSKNPLLFPDSFSSSGTEQSQMLTFMNLLSHLSFSIFQVLGRQNISHPAIAEKGWRSLW